MSNAEDAEHVGEEPSENAERAQPLLTRSFVLTLIVGLIAIGIAVGFKMWPRDGVYVHLPLEGKDVSPEVVELLDEIDQVVADLVKTYANRPDAIDVMAQLHNRFGDADVAERSWQRCLELDSNYLPAYVALASQAATSGKHDEAERYLRAVELHDPRSAVTRVDLADSLLRQGKLDEAVSLLEESFQQHPSLVPTLVLLGQAYVQQKRFAEARGVLESAIRKAPDFTNAYYCLGQACSKLDEPEKAQEFLKRFKELKEQDEQRHRDELKSMNDLANVQSVVASFFASAAKVTIAGGDVETAERLLLRGIEIHAQDTENRLILAWLFWRQGRVELALEVLSAAAERGQQDLAALVQLGEMYVQLGRFEEAEQAYQGAIHLTPHQAGAYAALARLYLEANRNVPQSVGLAAKAVELEPSAQFFSILGLALQRNGDSVRALQAFRRASQLEPDNPEIQRMLKGMQGSP